MADMTKKPVPNNAPTYMCMYPGLAAVARENGYALAVHGSLARDMDLIAVPWTEQAGSPEDVISAIEEKFSIKRIGNLTTGMHGRLIQTIGILFGECFIDLSFVPRSPAQAVAYWLCVNNDTGLVEIGFSTDIGEMARQQANEWINDQEHPGMYRLVGVSAHNNVSAEQTRKS